MSQSEYLVTCYLDPFLNLYQASNLLTGLCLLSARQEISLRFQVPWKGSKSYTDDALLIRLTVQNVRTETSKEVIVDLYDRSDRFTRGPLESCDWYFKRSYYAPDLDRLPTALKTKVRSFGLNYACRSRQSVAHVLSRLAPDYALRLLRSLARGISHFREDIHRLQVRGFLRSPQVQEFESSPDSTLEPLVVFQTRLWAPDEVSAEESWEEVNESRVAVVRALRDAFGKRFVGGVQPTAFARKHFPDLLTNQPDGRQQYIEWSKRCLIGVYTRGLHHSYAFKLAEYLAGSKCIVSAPLRNELPAPLLAGKHYDEFLNPEQCVSQCERLIRDSTLARERREHAWQYYRSQVEPSARAAAFLQAAAAPREKKSSQSQTWNVPV